MHTHTVVNCSLKELGFFSPLCEPPEENSTFFFKGLLIGALEKTILATREKKLSKKLVGDNCRLNFSSCFVWGGGIVSPHFIGPIGLWSSSRQEQGRIKQIKSKNIVG